MPKLSLLTAALTATKSLPASTWPRQPILPRWPELLQRVERTLRFHREQRRRKHQQSQLTRGQALDIGSLDAPLPASSWRAALEPLAEAPAGAIRLISKAQEVPPDLAVLLEIDQHHALQIDLVLDAEDLADFARPAWQVIRALADFGIAVRVGIRHVLDASDQEYHLYQLFEKAIENGAFDLFPITATESNDFKTRARQARWSETCERLRLEYCCPRKIAGRG